MRKTLRLLRFKYNNSMIKQNTIKILLVSVAGLPVAEQITRAYPQAVIYSKNKIEGVEKITSIQAFLEAHFTQTDTLIFIGAMGICVRSIAPFVGHKYHDPAVIAIDSTGKNVISVMSGHVGGANALTKDLALLLSAHPVITTQSDNTDLWALDILGQQFGWATESNCINFNEPLTLFVNGKPTALLLECRDKGTAYLEQSLPPHVEVFYHVEDIDFQKFELLISVSPYLREAIEKPHIHFIPKMLHMGVGCRRMCNKEGIAHYIEQQLKANGLSPKALADIATITLKKDEPLVADLQASFGDLPVQIYTSKDLQKIEVPNPSQKVKSVTQSVSVSEASAINAAQGGKLLLKKQKGSWCRSKASTSYKCPI